MEAGSLTFKDEAEEITHWKSVALEFKLKFVEVGEELEDFQVNSRELETELETQLEQSELRNKELKVQNNKLQFECDSLKERLEKCHKDYNEQISELTKQLGQIRLMKDDLMKYIRELEQSNDDLERAKRATQVSVQDIDLRLNQAIERNAFLESELDEKETLAVSLQRLKDESRDLRSELQSRNTTPDNDRQGHVKRMTSQPRVNGPQSPALIPSARLSALSIVGDLLRKVGALESKLASCRSFVKDSSQPSVHNNSFLSVNNTLPRSSSCPDSKDPATAWGVSNQ